MKIVAALIVSASLFTCAAEKPNPVPTTAKPEVLDLATIDRIRDEGLNNSHIMEYASGLFDGVGPRLTASPDFVKAQEWSLDQLRRMGASNPHTESWGEFGMGWRQIGTSVLMTAPSTATILAQATPWSPATAGEVTGEVIAVPDLKEEKDFDAWKGKLAGKVILYGEAPKINPSPGELLKHYDAAKLEHFRTYPLDGDQSDSFILPNDPAFWEKEFKERAFLERLAVFSSTNMRSQSFAAADPAAFCTTIPTPPSAGLSTVRNISRQFRLPSSQTKPSAACTASSHIRSPFPCASTS